MNCSRRSFLGGSGAMLFAGCTTAGRRVPTPPGGAPSLKFGVLSDIHIVDWESTEIFRKTLRYFRDSKVNAVLIAGDLADHGLLPQLENVAKAWFEVFPDDKGPDGEKVERLFIYGNHDPDGLNYRDSAMDQTLQLMHLTYEEAKKLSLSALGLGKCWEKCFHEPYSPIYHKNVLGYDFIGGHWDEANGSTWTTGPKIDEWMETNGKKINTDQPFFYFQHPHPRGTVFATDTWGEDDGASVRALAPYPKAVAFSGHAHRPLTDGRNYWRGEFTSIGTSSLSYVCPPERLKDNPNYRPEHNCRHGQIVSVFDDRLVIERRDFINDESLGDDIVLDLSKPSTFIARGVTKKIEPKFAEEAKAEVKLDEKVLTITFPGAFANATATPFEYRIEIDFKCDRKDKDGKTAEKSEWRHFNVLQNDACFSRQRAVEKGMNVAVFERKDFPEGAKSVEVWVTALNCYGCGMSQLKSLKFEV